MYSCTYTYLRVYRILGDLNSQQREIILYNNNNITPYFIICDKKILAIKLVCHFLFCLLNLLILLLTKFPYKNISLIPYDNFTPIYLFIGKFYSNLYRIYWNGAYLYQICWNGAYLYIYCNWAYLYHIYWNTAYLYHICWNGTYLYSIYWNGEYLYHIYWNGEYLYRIYWNGAYLYHIYWNEACLSELSIFVYLLDWSIFISYLLEWGLVVVTVNKMRNR